MAVNVNLSSLRPVHIQYCSTDVIYCSELLTRGTVKNKPLSVKHFGELQKGKPNVLRSPLRLLRLLRLLLLHSLQTPGYLI